MLAWSRYTALIFAIGLAIGEAVINWGHWQYAPLWIVDYIVAAWLAIAFWRTGRGASPLELTSAWAFACGVFYMALFIWLSRIRDGNVQAEGKQGLITIIGIMLCLTAAGIATSLLAARRTALRG